LPFFVVEKEDGRKVLCTVEPRKQTKKEYTIPDTNENSRFIIANCSSVDIEDLLVFHVKEGDHVSDIEQHLKVFKL
jgi:hypothetical protein